MRVFGVSFDTVEENKAFRDKFSFPFALLSDPSRAMGLAWGTADSANDGYAKRFTYVIAPDGTIEQAIDTQDPAAQADAILTALG